MRCLGALLAFAIVAGTDAHAATIAIVAGDPSHPYGAHEFPAGAELLASDLRAAAIDANVEVHRGWPEAPGAIEDVDAIVFFLDGGDDHPAREHRADLDRLAARGAGIMAMHYAVEVPAGPDGDAFRRWIGGFYETGWSTNPTWTAHTSLDDTHPIARGVEPFEAYDEWYFNIRFREDASDVIPVLTAVPDDEARSGSTSWPRGPLAHVTEASGRRETLLWAVERSDGGRGVGFTGGHFHWNWANPDFRTLVLNAIVWVAGREVPSGGVASSPRTIDALAETLPPETALKWIDRGLRFDAADVKARFAPPVE